jgi:uncharacterized protein YjbI with pentapeptide repeats
MKNLVLIFSVLLSTYLYGQIGPDGTGTVNGYYIGPYIDIGWTDANLAGADLRNANLTGAALARADFTGADLTGADLTEAELISATLTGATLTDTDLTGANLAGATLMNTDFSGAILSGVQSGYIVGTPTLPSGYQIVSEKIVGPGANLIFASFSYSDLSNINLIGADLRNANLAYSDLSGANLTEANLTGANLTGANLNGTIISNSTKLSAAFNMNWLSAQGAIVPSGTIITKNYILETYSSTDLENWTLIKSETIESSEDIMYLKTRLVEAE